MTKTYYDDLDLIHHIESYEDLPFVRKVIGGESSFVNEARKFYDLGTYEEFVPEMFSLSFTESRYIAGIKKPEKTGTVPKELVDVISPFIQPPLDLNKLEYDSVWSDYERPVSWKSRWSNLYLPMLTGMCAPIAALSSLYWDYAQGNIPIVDGSFNPPLSVCLKACLAGIAIGIGGQVISKKLKPVDDRPALREFERLSYGTVLADSFMNTDYRSYFIEKHLDDNITAAN